MARKGADSAYGPSAADLEAAIGQGVTWWGWYVGGRGALHVWTDAEVAVLDALTYSLPIWVPTLDLSGNPATDYAVARDRARALGWHGPIALDTEASMRGNVRLHSYVDGWCVAAAAAGDPQVVYGGGNYVGSAHPWWIINSTTPAAGQCYQNGSGNIGGTSVDFDYADDAFPLASRQAPVPPPPPPPPPTYTLLEDGRTLAHVSITTSAVNGSGYADCSGDPGNVDGWSVEGLDPAPVAAGGEGQFFEYGSVSFAAVKGRPGVCRVCLSSSNVKGGTVGVNVTFGTPAT